MNNISIHHPILHGNSELQLSYTLHDKLFKFLVLDMYNVTSLRSKINETRTLTPKHTS